MGMRIGWMSSVAVMLSAIGVNYEWNKKPIGNDKKPYDSGTFFTTDGSSLFEKDSQAPARDPEMCREKLQQYCLFPGMVGKLLDPDVSKAQFTQNLAICLARVFPMSNVEFLRTETPQIVHVPISSEDHQTISKQIAAIEELVINLSKQQGLETEGEFKEEDFEILSRSIEEKFPVLDKVISNIVHFLFDNGYGISRIEISFQSRNFGVISTGFPHSHPNDQQCVISFEPTAYGSTGFLRKESDIATIQFNGHIKAVLPCDDDSADLFVEANGGWTCFGDVVHKGPEPVGGEQSGDAYDKYLRITVLPKKLK